MQVSIIIASLENHFPGIEKDVQLRRMGSFNVRCFVATFSVAFEGGSPSRPSSVLEPSSARRFSEQRVSFLLNHWTFLFFLAALCDFSERRVPIISSRRNSR